MSEPDITGLLALPRDLVMTPVAELAPELQRRLTSEAGDVVLNRVATRVRASVVDAGTAELLELFRAPTRIVDAVILFSQRHGIDGKALLVDVFPAFQSFLADEFLVAADAVSHPAPTPLFAPHQRIGPAEVIRCIRFLVDTEVYEAKLDNGLRVALKIATGSAANSMAREAVFLRKLDGQVTPKLRDEFDVAGRHALVMEWCPGTSASLYAASLRAHPGRVSQRRRLALCQRVAEAYATLHEEGVLHGDVHPENVVVDPHGNVRLVDFGLARLTREQTMSGLPGGAVWFFLAPERAQQVALGRRLPAPTLRSEQYSVAALLYLLWTGEHYLDFSLETDSVLTQIREETPRPFASATSPEEARLEAAVRRGLEKEPHRRFPNMRSFARRIDAISQGLATPTAVPPRAESFVGDTLRACRLSGTLMRSLTPPTSSVYYGAGGIAFALLRMARARSDPSLLALSDAWCLLAERDLGHVKGTENAELEINTSMTGRVTPFHTAAGVSCVRAAISHAFGDASGVASAQRAFVLRSQHPCTSPELTLGYAGVLTATVALKGLTSGEHKSLDSLMTRVGKRLSRRMQRMGTPGRSPLETLGMAHGWAGILYALLRWARGTGRAAEPSWLEGMDSLAKLGEKVANGRRWPFRSGSATSMRGWCNGSAGMVLLWNEAAVVTGDRRFRLLAEQAARDCTTDDTSTFDLCCGLAGRAYSLYVLGRDSGNADWSRKAQKLAERALRARRSGTFPVSSHEGSLFRGDLGLAMLLVELEQPDLASFPFLERL